jgi:hypothetical protein
MFLKKLICLIGLFIYTSTRPFGKEVLDYLEKDALTFETYRKDYLHIACKLTIYSKLKYMWEKEELDQYLNKTDDKASYLRQVREEMMKTCAEKISSINVFIKK